MDSSYVSRGTQKGGRCRAHRSRTLALFACAAALLGAAESAHADTEDTGVWLAVFANGKLPPSWNDARNSWRLWADAALRFGDDASRLSQGLLRGGVGYTLSDAWSIWAGYAYIRTDAPYASTPTNEQRLWQQAIWSGAIAKTKLSSRTRLEQRFFGAGSETGWRLREFLKLTQPLGSTDTWSMVISDEIFLNLNDATFTASSAASAGWDRNRFFVGPGVNFNSSLRAEFGYLNQHTFRNNGPDKNDQILAVNFFVNF
jgi:hypothetical protein